MITAGLDVGGAHLKVALVEDGRVIAAQQFACPLWQGFDKLTAAMAEAAPLLSRADRFAATMTGELSDLFASRAEGVGMLAGYISAHVSPQTLVWMGRRGFGSVFEAGEYPADVGSTNFLATAAYIATRLPDALLIDFGSTTADIIPIRDGKPCPRGLTDAERQRTGELVYTGYTRTAVMAVTNRAPFRGEWTTLAREYLATMADVRRISGIDLTGIDLHATADGKGKSRDESIARLARMFGRDADNGSEAEWRTAAHYLMEMQLRSIDDGIRQVLSGSYLPSGAPFVVAGIGAHEVAQIGVRHARPVALFPALVGATAPLARWAEACAPAVSVALLAERVP